MLPFAFPQRNKRVKSLRQNREGSGETEGEAAMATQTATAEFTTHHRPFFRSLYFQVLTAIVLGVLLGHFYPELGEQMKPLGDAFIKTIKMIIAPIIFCTVVHGIASMQDMKRSEEHTSELQSLRHLVCRLLLE